MPVVAQLWRHPIKAHGVEAIAATDLVAGEAMPWDRVWAIAHEAARVTEDAPGWVPCANFSRGAKSPSLMAIRARLDEATGRIALTHPDRPPIALDPDDAADRRRLIDWVTPISDPDRARPAFVTRAGVGLTDSPFPSISLLSLASLRALSQRIGRPLAMERFRGNLWVEGLGPWEEFEWLGRDLRIGSATLRVRERITRCKATTADPETGRPDADTLGALSAGWGHQDFGVFAEVVEGGRVALGDEVALSARVAA